MTNIRLLLRAEAARWKKRQYIGFLIVLIMIMIGTICYVRKPETSSNEKIVLGLVQEDASEYADLMLQYFRENKEFLSYVELIEDSEEKLKEALRKGGMDAYLLIPEGFVSGMIQMENRPIQAVVSMKNPTKALVLRYVMEAYENYIEVVEVNCTALYRRMKEEGFSVPELEEANVEISLELIFTALGKDDLYRRRTLETEKELSLAEHYKLTAVYFVVLFLFMPSGLRIIELRQSGLSARLKSMNVSTVQQLLAVGIPYALGASTLFLIYCYMEGIAGRFFTGILWILPWLPVFCVLGMICDNHRSYLFLCSMLLVCMAVLGGSLIPEQFLPDVFQKVASWLPNRNFRYVMGGMN